MKNRKDLRSLIECAVMIALSVILSYAKIPLGAFGGSVDFVMVPLFIMSYRNGVKYGLIGCTAFGLIKCLVSGSIGWGIWSVLLDYVIAYGVCGLAGLFKGKKSGLFIGAIVGSISRFIIHFISGVTIYKILVPTEVTFLNIASTTTGDAVIYSLIYNASYMLPNTVIALILCLVFAKAVDRVKY